MNKLLLLNRSGLVKILKKDNTTTVTILVPPRNFFKPVEILYKNLPDIFKRIDYKFIEVYDIININIKLENYLIFYKLVTDEKDIGRFGLIEKINDKDKTINFIFISEKVKLSDIEEIYYIY